jgi:hypothetical protein
LRNNNIEIKDRGIFDNINKDFGGGKNATTAYEGWARGRGPGEKNEEKRRGIVVTHSDKYF